MPLISLLFIGELIYICFASVVISVFNSLRGAHSMQPEGRRRGRRIISRMGDRRGGVSTWCPLTGGNTMYLQASSAVNRRITG